MDKLEGEGEGGTGEEGLGGEKGHRPARQSGKRGHCLGANG